MNGTSTYEIASDDLSLLIPLVADVIDTTANPFSYDPSTSTLSFPDRVYVAFHEIVNDPDWRAKSRRKALFAYAADVRYGRETGGAIINGIRVATDRESQAMLNGAVSMAMQDSDFSTYWKQANGSFVGLDAPTIIALGSAVGTHVAACFSTEAYVGAGITSGAIATTAQIDAAFAEIA